MSDEIKSVKPHDKLTRICEAMTLAMDCSEESTGQEKAIVLIQDGNRGGMVLHGYADDKEALADFMQHAEALFKTFGVKMKVMPMPGGFGEG